MRVEVESTVDGTNASTFQLASKLPVVDQLYLRRLGKVVTEAANQMTKRELKQAFDVTKAGKQAKARVKQQLRKLSPQEQAKDWFREKIQEAVQQPGETLGKSGYTTKKGKTAFSTAQEAAKKLRIEHVRSSQARYPKREKLDKGTISFWGSINKKDTQIFSDALDTVNANIEPALRGEAKAAKKVLVAQDTLEGIY